jgi:bacterioferritin
MVVCHCERVNDRTIRKLIRDAEITVDDVIASCGAGGRCGGCRASIEQTPRSRHIRAGTPVVPALGSTFVQGSPEIIEFLNEALTAELTAINQYFAHAKLCENWGWMVLAKKYREESIEEMMDAEKLMERILMLDGMPNLQRLGSVRVGETVEEQLQVDGELEVAAIERYRRGVRWPWSSAIPAPAICSRASSSARNTTSTGSRPRSR